MQLLELEPHIFKSHANVLPPPPLHLPNKYGGQVVHCYESQWEAGITSSGRVFHLTGTIVRIVARTLLGSYSSYLLFHWKLFHF